MERPCNAQSGIRQGSPRHFRQLLRRVRKECRRASQCRFAERTNQLHGSGLFKFDDPAFNAFNSYGGYGLPPTRVDQLYRQFGMSVGGPIIKNRLFYFFSYEGLRNNSVNYVNQWVETPDFRQAVIAARPGSMAAQILGAPGEVPRVASVANVPCPSGFAPGTCQQVSGGLDIGSITGARGAYTSATGGGLDGLPIFNSPS